MVSWLLKNRHILSSRRTLKHPPFPLAFKSSGALNHRNMQTHTRLKIQDPCLLRVMLWYPVYMEVNGPIPHPRNPTEYVGLKDLFQSASESAVQEAKIVIAELKY
jgi:hypothetical protein